MVRRGHSPPKPRQRKNAKDGEKARLVKTVNILNCDCKSVEDKTVGFNLVCLNGICELICLLPHVQGIDRYRLGHKSVGSHA